ncbi:hypothetical protein CAEBREN_13406 [Caenorhabditis brenneri]|uniref:Uncharacterized protein n=1 Tax=Caenorhabditis brenneri TaxID=135651 RepID=G0MWW8_CAEBE|nr:hypothetical protein CAEBREN_13406 [Caenorhabditis brenneri]
MKYLRFGGFDQLEYVVCNYIDDILDIRRKLKRGENTQHNLNGDYLKKLWTKEDDEHLNISLIEAVSANRRTIRKSDVFENDYELFRKLCDDVTVPSEFEVSRLSNGSEILNYFRMKVGLAAFVNPTLKSEARVIIVAMMMVINQMYSDISTDDSFLTLLTESARWFLKTSSRSYMTTKVHELLAHLPEVVKKFGNVAPLSTFAYEHFYKYCLKNYNPQKTKGFSESAISRVILNSAIRKELENRMKNSPSSSIIQFVKLTPQLKPFELSWKQRIYMLDSDDKTKEVKEMEHFATIITQLGKLKSRYGNPRSSNDVFFAEAQSGLHACFRFISAAVDSNGVRLYGERIAAIDSSRQFHLLQRDVRKMNRPAHAHGYNVLKEARQYAGLVHGRVCGERELIDVSKLRGLGAYLKEGEGFYYLQRTMIKNRSTKVAPRRKTVVKTTNDEPKEEYNSRTPGTSGSMTKGEERLLERQLKRTRNNTKGDSISEASKSFEKRCSKRTTKKEIEDDDIPCPATQNQEDSDNESEEDVRRILLKKCKKHNQKFVYEEPESDDEVVKSPLCNSDEEPDYATMKGLSSGKLSKPGKANIYGDEDESDFYQSNASFSELKSRKANSDENYRKLGETETLESSGQEKRKERRINSSEQNIWNASNLMRNACYDSGTLLTKEQCEKNLSAALKSKKKVNFYEVLKLSRREGIKGTPLEDVVNSLSLTIFMMGRKHKEEKPVEYKRRPVSQFDLSKAILADKEVNLPGGKRLLMTSLLSPDLCSMFFGKTAAEKSGSLHFGTAVLMAGFDLSDDSITSLLNTIKTTTNNYLGKMRGQHKKEAAVLKEKLESYIEENEGFRSSEIPLHEEKRR